MEHAHVVEFDLAVWDFNGLREVKEFLVILTFFSEHLLEIYFVFSFGIASAIFFLFAIFFLLFRSFLFGLLEEVYASSKPVDVVFRVAILGPLNHDGLCCLDIVLTLTVGVLEKVEASREHHDVCRAILGGLGGFP